MDLWTILIGIVACCVSAILVYAIMTLTMRERSFEEVLAEQKKRQNKEKEKSKNDKKIEKEMLKKKYRKGKGDKSKEKVTQAVESDQTNGKSEQKEHKMVNLELVPEIIESSGSAKQKNKGQSVVRKRSILHNKDELAPVVEKAAELHHKPFKPLDDVELKKLHDSKTGKKGKAPGTEFKVEVRETKVQKTKATGVQQGLPVEEQAVKAKSATAVNSKPPLKRSPLMDSLQSAELSDVEIQSMIEVLMNRQGSGTDVWPLGNKKKKGDPVVVMKKQLEEKEKALQEEHQRAIATVNQVKELRATLSSEREKGLSMEKCYQGQLSQHKGEKEALMARLSSIHTSHMADTAKLKMLVEQLEEQKNAEATASLKLRQENKILQESLSKAIAGNVMQGDVSGLKQKVAIMEKELSNTALRLNAAENAKKSSQEKMKKYEEQIKKLESAKSQQTSDEGLKQQVNDLKAELSKANSQNGQLSAEMKKATGALSTVQSECSMWKTKLQELERHLSSLSDVNLKLQGSEEKCQELEANVKNLEKQLTDTTHSKQDLAAQIQQLRQENSSLCKELKMVKESQQTQPSATNGDVHNDSNYIPTTEHQRIVSEKVSELSRVQSALDDQTKKNNEELKKAVSETERKDRELIKRLFPAINVTDNLEHREWLAMFEKQFTQQKEQNSNSEKEKMNHLADENSRLQSDVEVFKNNIAILHSEKDRIQELEEENRKLHHQCEDYEKSFVQLHADQDKLRHLEEESQRLKSMSATNISLTEKLTRLEEQNTELQSQLQEKEESIAEVESKLQQLERVVEEEEKAWKEKLKQAEQSTPQVSGSSSREQELEDLTIQQQTQIEHYRTVLTNTEQLLRQLESGEKTWEEKLQTAQDDLQKSRADCKKFQDELHALRGSTEMQLKMDDMQEELRQSSEQVDKLTRSNQELTSKVIVLETQGKAITQLDTEKLRKELGELRGQLDAERKRNKELSSTLVRLNGIIKTGQDALSHEQKTVQQLQEQLSTKSSGSNPSQEIEQGSSSSSDLGTSV